MTKQNILKAFQFRHACKEFDPSKKVAKEDMDFILETARLSPSSFGIEPWHFIVVQDAELREKLKNGAWGATKKLETASHFVVCLTMKSHFLKYDSPYVKNFMKNVQHLSDEVIEPRSKFYTEFQKSDFNLSDDRKLFDWAAKQSYIPLANMMTTAAMLGIDSCPIEGFKQAETDAVLQQDFGVDTTQYGISYMVAFGYRVNEPKIKTRRSTEEVITWR
ncbi:NAD(P)H-dependent oxidoreductase [Methylotenera versatilis]|uniref:Nitroreductase n=1 Tax=Methylotenera versatilis (strain 301) TaxID=666681 RepID=D7DPD3_METV0|nr:NAD(P)H-dependent oxidoreductase [Methylotenera versatilis]ADI29177.1 nitroreductase [Methylotenera versatilis 301]